MKTDTGKIPYSIKEIYCIVYYGMRSVRMPMRKSPWRVEWGRKKSRTWNRIVDTYGVSKAYGILGAIRAIMIGNAYGIPWSSLMNRFKGKPDKRCSWFYEVEVITLGSLLMPFAMIQALAAAVFRLPLISFRCSD